MLVGISKRVGVPDMSVNKRHNLRRLVSTANYDTIREKLEYIFSSVKKKDGCYCFESITNEAALSHQSTTANVRLVETTRNADRFVKSHCIREPSICISDWRGSRKLLRVVSVARVAIAKQLSGTAPLR